jgi:tetratricopeptide (TPR) repeat protein
MDFPSSIRPAAALAQGVRGCMPDNFDLEQILNAALAQHEAGQLDLAESGYRTVLQYDPDEPDALNLLGVILQERGELDESIALLTRALALVPDFPEALANLARAKRAAGAPTVAADAARRAIALDPALAEAHLQLGQALLDLDDPAGAAAALRQATTLAPQSADALQLLGVALMRLQDHQAAADCMTAALALDPTRADTTASLALVLTELARAHRVTGDAEAAVAAARRAVALNPALPDAQFELGSALLMQQENAGAIEALQRVTELAPESPEAWAAFARALTADGDGQSSAEAWQAALALQPDDPGLLIDFAGSLVKSGRSEEALTIFRQAEALAPGDRRAPYGIASCLWNSGDFFATAEVCRQVLEAAADLPAFWMLLGDCETAMGHFDKAAECYRRAVALDPGAANSLHAPVVPGAHFQDHDAWHASWEVLNDPTRRVNDRIAAGFALAHLSDREGAYDRAFEACALANRLLRDDRAARGFVFDHAEFHDVVDGQVAAIGPPEFLATAGWGDPSELPVFIVGMPRSGTSLVEQIAASHPLVYGAGERMDIDNIVATLDNERASDGRVVWDRAQVRREAMAHVHRLRSLDGQATRVIDKLPDNILHLGKIAILFPRARIVVCRRDARDTGLSCFFQYFHADALAWTNDLADCGFRTRETERLMDHWRKVLPLTILEIQYETLVANLESESRRLIDFLGLEWDPACLAFHETKRPVLTASLWQVRQPIYSSSIGRWRHYRHHLGPLLRELEGLVPPDDEDPSHAG